MQVNGDLPVFLGNKTFDLPLPLNNDPQSHRLDASGAHAGSHFFPQQRADLVTDDTVENAAGDLRVDLLAVEFTGMFEGLQNRFLRDLLERDAIYLFPVTDMFHEIPADRLSLAVRVSGEIDLLGAFDVFFQFRQQLGLVPHYDKFRLKIVLDIHAKRGFR